MNTSGHRGVPPAEAERQRIAARIAQDERNAAIVEKYRIGGAEHRRTMRQRQAKALGVGRFRLWLRCLADQAMQRRQRPS